MSIAVSAVVRPSRIVLGLTLTMCVGSASIGAFFGCYSGAAMPALVRIALGASCVLAGLIVACQILRNRCVQRIEISGIGQIRVHAADTPQAIGHHFHDPIGSPVCCQDLLPSSTLWAHFMILNLQAKDGIRTTLLIMPDTMSQTSFRGLSVACHWIAAHNNRDVLDIK